MQLNETQRRLADIFAQNVVTMPDGKHCYVFSLNRFDELVRAAWISGRTEGVAAGCASRITGRPAQPTTATETR